MKDFLSVEQIAQALHVSEETVRIWIRTKKLPAIRIGRDYRVTQEDFDAFIKQRRTIDEKDEEDG